MLFNSLDTAEIDQARPLLKVAVGSRQPNRLPHIRERFPWHHTSSTVPVKNLHSAGSHHRVEAQSTQPTCPPALIRSCVALPSQAVTGDLAVLHPVLQYKPRAPYTTWDLTVPLDGAQGGSRAYMMELATKPSLPSMTVVHPQLPWCITVHQSHCEGVMVADVLRAIFSAMGTYLGGGGGMRLQLLSGRMLVGLRKSGVDGDVWEMVVG